MTPLVDGRSQTGLQRLQAADPQGVNCRPCRLAPNILQVCDRQINDATRSAIRSFCQQLVRRLPAVRRSSAGQLVLHHIAALVGSTDQAVREQAQALSAAQQRALPGAGFAGAKKLLPRLHWRYHRRCCTPLCAGVLCEQVLCIW